MTKSDQVKADSDKATPRPWTIQQLNHADRELWLQIGFFDNDGREVGPITELVGGAVKMYRPVAEFQHLIAPDEEVRANAQLIVTAVNAHDALVAALHRYRAEHDFKKRAQRGGEGECTCGSCHHARLALADKK